MYQLLFIDAQTQQVRGLDGDLMAAAAELAADADDAVSHAIAFSLLLLQRIQHRAGERVIAGDEPDIGAQGGAGLRQRHTDAAGAGDTNAAQLGVLHLHGDAAAGEGDVLGLDIRRDGGGKLRSSRLVQRQSIGICAAGLGAGGGAVQHQLVGQLKELGLGGQSVIKFLYWLEHNWQGCNELDVVRKLHEFRAAEELFYSNSFETIAAFGPDGAIVHYQPTPQTNRELTADSVLLLDSGAQYYDGTTDITRTIAIGSPEKEIADSFTQVLKAHIAVASACFPENASGCALDGLARAQLWNFGKDYNHGTGHGVGCFLNVHEGPHSLSARNTGVPLKSGMISSIEPGYYKEGAYGIRIENLACIVNADNEEFPLPMLKFEPLTLVPIDKRLINKYLLNHHETAWLNQYHRRVFEEISPLLEPELQQWLEKACAPL